ncbi:MAG TPA: hypothetical protein VF073_02340 [Gaiella sp.]
MPERREAAGGTLVVVGGFAAAYVAPLDERGRVLVDATLGVEGAEPYGYRTLCQVATLGWYEGIAELPGVRLRDFLGWFVARTYHLYALPTFRRKTRAVADWTVSLFFQRDIVELSALGHPRHLDP